MPQVPLAKDLVGRCRQLWNMYGPTETTVWSSVYHVTKAYLDTNPTIVPIGKPILNTVFYLLDPDAEQPVRVKSGEVCMGPKPQCTTTADRVPFNHGGSAGA